jgi:hypothetical protein
MTTRTIRIPLVVDADGRWAACDGTHSAEVEWAEMEWFLQGATRRYWITVTVDLPTTAEVSGTVEADAS